MPQAKKFHDPIKSNELKTINDMDNKKKVMFNGRSVILKADRSLFRRVIVMTQGHNLEMQEILTHPLGAPPWELWTPASFLSKTNKTILKNLLQKNAQVAEQMPSNSAAVIDRISLAQKMSADHMSFGHVADTVLSIALREGAQCKRVYVVFDVYQEKSIKNSERLMRGEEIGHQLCNITRSQIVRQ